MIQKIALSLLLVLLSYGFWVSNNFKEIAAGMAILLLSMNFLEEGFKAFAGDTLEKILQRSTNKLYKSLLFGVITTTMMQSSALVSLLTISFLSAGLISLAQGIGIVFGANIGTTTGAWLVAGFGLKVDIASYGMPMLVFGVIFIFQKSQIAKGLGYILVGLGFLFLGIHFMKEGFEAFKNTIDLSAYAVEGIKGLFIFTGIGIFATVVMQSSHATLVLIITALAAGQITYDNALGLAIGANVGTTITAILGSMSSNVQGKRLAGAHLIFNVITGLIAIVFIKQLIWAVEGTSAYVGIAHDDYALKLAVFHTFFNIIGVVVMVPFIDRMVVFLEKVLQPVQSVDLEMARAEYLNSSVMDFEESAVEALLNETRHLYDNAYDVIVKGLNIDDKLIHSESEIKLESFDNVNIKKDIDEMYIKQIKGVYGDIIDFATKAQAKMSPGNIEKIYKLKLASRNIAESVKTIKHMQKNVKRYLFSKNSDIKKEYNSIRKTVAEFLRIIEKVKTAEEDVIIVLLGEAKILIEKSDIVANGTLDKLIRNGSITKEMATSLMNDSAYLYEVGKDLIEVAEVIFAHRESMLSEVKQEIGITDNDMDKLL